MNLDLSDVQSSLRDTLLEVFEKGSTPADVRAAEPLGFDAALWRTVADMGIPSIAVPAESGGGGGGLLDVAIAAECAGWALAPVPLVESAVATTLLASFPEVPAVEPWLARAVSGQAIATLALHPARGGVARVVPAGAIADVVVALRGDELVALEPERPGAPLPNLGSMPVAHVAVDRAGTVVLASGQAAHDAHHRAVRHWQLLTANVLVGLASRSLEMAVAYVQQRRAFGVLIANFQTIQHRLADDVTAIEGARLLARQAAWACDEALPSADQLALMAFLFASETALRTAADSLHFHGGYGFTLEYDIQLFFRRAKGWALVAGDPKALYAELARRATPDEEV